MPGADRSAEDVQLGLRQDDVVHHPGSSPGSVRRRPGRRPRPTAAASRTSGECRRPRQGAARRRSREGGASPWTGCRGSGRRIAPDRRPGRTCTPGRRKAPCRGSGGADRRWCPGPSGRPGGGSLISGKDDSVQESERRDRGPGGAARLRPAARSSRTGGSGARTGGRPGSGRPGRPPPIPGREVGIDAEGEHHGAAAGVARVGDVGDDAAAEEVVLGITDLLPRLVADQSPAAARSCHRGRRSARGRRARRSGRSG